MCTPAKDAASLRAFGELLHQCEAQLPGFFVGASVFSEAHPGELVQGLAESLRQLLAARGDTLESVQWTASPPAKSARPKGGGQGRGAQGAPSGGAHARAGGGGGG